jgi:hypothetical protein
MSADEMEAQTKVRAYGIWINEGRPDGRAEANWTLACEELAVEETIRVALCRLHDVSPPGRAQSCFDT